MTETCPIIINLQELSQLMNEIKLSELNKKAIKEFNKKYGVQINDINH